MEKSPDWWKYLRNQACTLTDTGTVLRGSVSQQALRRAPHPGVAGLHRSLRSREGVWKSHRGVCVNGLRRVRLRSEWLVVQAPGHAQVASVLVHTAHISPASIWQRTALVHIWKTKWCAETWGHSCLQNICGPVIHSSLRVNCFSKSTDKNLTGENQDSSSTNHCC